MNDSVASLGWVRVAVHAVRTAITVAALTLLVGFGAISPSASPRPAGPTSHLDMSSGPLDAMMQANRCSVTGFDRSVIPRKAIVRTPGGTTKLVSFDRGWAVFSGEVAGELVAVCLGPDAAPAARLP
ncbi:hypothetical protein RB608_05295 [Nocardioides sp. LHD-245]|uniref:hypothetical protein n=1 Tax=Nocardioides sp. LHD-245 TaxID=3051387 RepID=UPI0027DEE6E5|nr:hypothetical protein [Nocardioides sp. LHD-245]